MEILLLAHRAELGVLEMCVCVCVGVLVHGMCAYVWWCVWCGCVGAGVSPFIWVITLPCEVIGETMW